MFEYKPIKTYEFKLPEIKIPKIPEIKFSPTFEFGYTHPNKDPYFSPSRMRERSFELDVLRTCGPMTYQSFMTSPFRR